MWIVGQHGDDVQYAFSSGMDAPATIVLTHAPASLLAQAKATGARVVIRDDIEAAGYAALAAELTGSLGFDDIIALDLRSAHTIGELAKHIARRGTLNLVGRAPLDGDVAADVGRLHYDYIAFVGCTGPDISVAYGEERNRCELRANGVTVIIGAGGPMGQMHLQRALELPDGPRTIIATDVNDTRLAALRARFAPLAEQHNRHLLVLNPAAMQLSLRDAVLQLSNGKGADDITVCVPSAEVMAEAGSLLNPEGMLILFAGVPNGTLAPLNLSNVYLNNAQITGTSGLTIHDQAQVMRSAERKALSPGRSVAAIGGMRAARDGIEALMNGRFAGKIVIFPQIMALPLIGLDELHTVLPQVAAKLGQDNTWTIEAEAELIESGWRQPGKPA